MLLTNYQHSAVPLSVFDCIISKKWAAENLQVGFANCSDLASFDSRKGRSRMGGRALVGVECSRRAWDGGLFQPTWWPVIGNRVAIFQRSRRVNCCMYLVFWLFQVWCIRVGQCLIRVWWRAIVSMNLNVGGLVRSSDIYRFVLTLCGFFQALRRLPVFPALLCTAFCCDGS